MTSDTNRNATITVIMPAYNCEKFIEQAVASILNQNYKRIKLIVLDDASTDNTWDILNSIKDPRLITYKNDINLGNLKSINHLFTLCKTDFIAFQDADDWSHQDRLKIQLRFLNDNPDISFCGTNCILAYENKQVLKKYPSTDLTIRKELSNGRTSLFCAASILFKRDILTKIGNFNPLFDRLVAADINWFLRALHCYKGANISQVLYFYRQHENSITHTENNSILRPHASTIALFLHFQYQKNHVIDYEVIKQFLMGHYQEKTGDKLQQILEKALMNDFTGIIATLKLEWSTSTHKGKLFINFLIAISYYIFKSVIPRSFVQKIIGKNRLQKVHALNTSYSSYKNINS